MDPYLEASLEGRDGSPAGTSHRSRQSELLSKAPWFFALCLLGVAVVYFASGTLGESDSRLPRTADELQHTQSLLEAQKAMAQREPHGHETKARAQSLMEVPRALFGLGTPAELTKDGAKRQVAHIEALVLETNGLKPAAANAKRAMPAHLDLLKNVPSAWLKDEELGFSVLASGSGSASGSASGPGGSDSGSAAAPEAAPAAASGSASGSELATGEKEANASRRWGSSGVTLGFFAAVLVGVAANALHVLPCR